MILRLIKHAALLTVGAICVLCATTAQANVVDLAALGDTAIFNDGTFTAINEQPTGTGVFEPFLTIQIKGAEAGYNTGATPPPLDTKRQGSPGDLTKGWTKDVLLSSLATDANGNYVFTLDINEKQSDAPISLNQVQIFASTTAGRSDGVVDPGTGRVTFPDGGANLIYDMNLGGGTANGVIIHGNHSSGNSTDGSGSADLMLVVPKTLVTGDWLLFYSQFGTPPGEFASDSGFEEWSYSAVPEPTTVLAGALLLLPFGASTLRVLRRKQTA